MAEQFRYDYSYFEKINSEIVRINSTSHEEEQIIHGLLDLLKVHHRPTYHHTLIVARIAYDLAIEAGLPQQEAGVIRSGALLHDIGKLFVPQALLQRSNGDFVSARQMELLKSHGKMGQDIIHSFLADDKSPKLPEVYEQIADKHNMGIGKGEFTKEELDGRHPFVPYVSVADFVASALDEGKKSLRTFEYSETIGFINRRIDRQYLPAEIRAPFNSLMGKYGHLSFDTSIGASNFYKGTR